MKNTIYVQKWVLLILSQAVSVRACVCDGQEVSQSSQQLSWVEMLLLPSLSSVHCRLQILSVMNYSYLVPSVGAGVTVLLLHFKLSVVAFCLCYRQSIFLLLSQLVIWC